MNNNRGSALVIVLLLIGAVMITSVAVMQNATSLSQVYAQKAHAQIADNVSQHISALASDPTVCLHGFDQVPGGEAGIQFLNGGAPGNFNMAVANAGGQDVSIPSNFTNPAGGRFRLAAGTRVPNTDLEITRLYVARASNDTANPLVARNMQLMAQYTIIQTPVNTALNVRPIMDLRIEVGGGGVMTACGPAPSGDSNRRLCEGMNCTYTENKDGPGSCFCPVEEMTCTNGTYIESIVNQRPLCSRGTITRECTSASSYLVALDGNGNPVCADIITCATGTSPTGRGAVAEPPECKCPLAGHVWNGSVCSFPVMCPAGTTTIMTRSPAAPLGCYCPTDQVWNGSACETPLNCRGGASTTITSSPAAPLGCYCPANQTWDGENCVGGSSIACYWRDEGFVAQSATNPTSCDTKIKYYASSNCGGNGPAGPCAGLTSECEPILKGDAREKYCPANPDKSICGSADGGIFPTAPSGSALCAKGDPSNVRGTGPWTWTCQGSNSGSGSGHNDVDCSADKSTTTTVAMCSDGVTPKLKYWESVSVDNSNGATKACSPYYNPNPPPNVTGSNNCNHIPDNFTNCSYSGNIQVCKSNCPTTSTTTMTAACVCWTASGFGGTTILFPSQSNGADCGTGAGGGTMGPGRCFKNGFHNSFLISCSDPAATHITKTCDGSVYCKEACDAAPSANTSNVTRWYGKAYSNQSACEAAEGPLGVKLGPQGGYYKSCRQCPDQPGYWQGGTSLGGNNDKSCF